MGQTTNQIETYIEDKRADLSSNLQELEGKVKSMTDWKHHFGNSPMTMMGLAFGGGILLATMMGSKSRRNIRRGYADGMVVSQPASASTAKLQDAALETWDHIKGALVGVAASRAKEFINEFVPGFQEQFQRIQNKGAKQSL